MNAVAERRRKSSVGETYTLEPERKRVCRSLEAVPQEITSCHPSPKNATDPWYMEQDLKQKVPTELFIPHNMKEMAKSMNFVYVLVNQIFPDNETRAAAQPCPRCIAGEPGHFGHMMGL